MEVVTACLDAKTGRVLIPGFYDEVEPLSLEDEDSFLSSGFSLDTFKRDHHVSSLRETDPLEVLRRLWAPPTFEVHGVVGGYTGPGVKTAIPPVAEVKLSCRLVPNMTCSATLERIRTFISERFPDVQVHAEPGLEPYRGHASGPLAEAVLAAYRFGFDTEAVFTREGGSIGAVPSMEQILHAPVVFLGLSLPEHGYHAPNEFFDWEQAQGGIAAFAALLQSSRAAFGADHLSTSREPFPQGRRLVRGTRNWEARNRNEVADPSNWYAQATRRAGGHARCPRRGGLQCRRQLRATSG